MRRLFIIVWLCTLAPAAAEELKWNNLTSADGTSVTINTEPMATISNDGEVTINCRRARQTASEGYRRANDDLMVPLARILITVCDGTWKSAP